MTTSTRSKIFAALLLLPSLLVLAVVVFYPLGYSIWMSFYDVRLAGLQATFVGMRNYVNLFTSPVVAPYFWEAFRNTLWFTIGSTLLATSLGVLVALILNTAFAGRALFRGLFLLPWLVPWVSASLLFMWMADPTWGVFNYVLKTLGIIAANVPWFGQTDTVLLGFIALNVWKLTPFMIIMVLAGLQSLPGELLAAARIDGANYLQLLRYIILPHLRSVLGSVTLISIIWNFQLFTPMWIISGGGPQNASTTLSIFQYKKAFYDFDFGLATSIGTVWLVFLVALSIVWVRFVMPRQQP